MKKILGLDLGTTSIGWAYVKDNGGQPDIRLGVRITPLTVEERESFTKGQAITTNRDRTHKRTARKTLDRFQLRRKRLLYWAQKLGWINDIPDFNQLRMSGQDLWYIRAKAANSQVSLEELVRVLLHINGKRGFKSNRKAVAKEDETSQFLKSISDNDRAVKEQSFTIAQWYCSELEYAEKNSKPLPRIKGLTFSRALHREEFDRIWDCQQLFYPELTEDLRKQIGDYTIFYQRRLKSQKRLISKCRFMTDCRVIPASHPLFELFRAWLDVNHLVVTTGPRKQPIVLDLSVKQELVEELHNLAGRNPLKAKTKMSATDVKKFLVKHLGGTTRDYHINFEELNGASTIIHLKAQFAKAGIKENSIFDWNPKLNGQAFDKQPLLRLWHDLYSIEDHDDLVRALMSHFGWNHDQAEVVAELGFSPSHGSLSSRAIRKILPHLQEGNNYTTACSLEKWKHSDSETLEEKQNRVLLERLPQVQRGKLRNPVVEKVMNQMVNVINAIIEDPEMGAPDEIHVEMGREITASAKQRSRRTKAINSAKKEHERIKAILKEEVGLKRVTRRDIQKYKMGEECDWISIYSGKPISKQQVFGANPQYDIDHIIPQSRLFDDSQSNKVLCEAELNREKGNSTAYDYIATKGAAELESFMERIRLLEKEPRNRNKVLKLRMKGIEIPDDFINRQLSESQYIASEAFKQLKLVCRDLIPTVGTITAHLRRQWGLEELIRDLNYSKYEAIGQVELETTRDGRQIPRIKDWSKRDDHRHHALDALVVALTSRSMVQRLNNLNQLRQETETIEESRDYQKAKSLRRFDPPIQHLRHLAKEALEDVLISYKTGKRVAAWSRSTIKLGHGEHQQRRILIPRGQLHLETVYGKNKRYASEPVALTKISASHLIRDPQAAEIWQERVNRFQGNAKKAFSKSVLKKNPFIVHGEVVEELPCWEENFVQRVELNEKVKWENIVDPKIRALVKERIMEAGMSALEAGNLAEIPIWQNEAKQIPIKKVRIYARAKQAKPLRDHPKGGGKDYVVLGNNHHIALYQKEDGKYHLESISLMEAITRKQGGEEVIKVNHEEGHRFVTSFQQNEYFIFSSLNMGELANDKKALSEGLFRVQKLTISDKGSPDIVFRHHLETDIKREKTFAMQRIRSASKLPYFKVRLDHLGRIQDLEQIQYSLD